MKTNLELSTFSVVRRLTASVRHLWWAYILAVLGAVAGFLITLVIPSLVLFLAWRALDGVVPSLGWLLVLFLLGLLRGGARYVEHLSGHYVAFKTLYDLRCQVFAKMRRLSPTKLDQNDSGVLLKVIGEDIEAMEVFFAHTLPPVMTASLVSLCLVLFYSSLSPAIAVVALFAYAMIALFLPRSSAKRLQPLLSAQSTMRKSYLSLFLESLKGMKELVQFNQANSRFSQLTKQSELVNAREKEVAQAQYLQAALSFLVIGLAILIVASLAFWQVSQRLLTIEQATLLIVVFATSFAPYLELSRLPLGFKRAITAACQVFALLDEEEADYSGQPLDETIESIKVEDVNFSYPSRSKEILSQVSVAFPRNQLIGIVGESGSGKTTLMKLLMRWYDPTAGQVLLNNHPLQEMDARKLQKRVAYIPQIPQLFSQSIRENLTLGDLSITEEAILKVAEQCHMKERILKTKDGLDTVLDSENLIFSAGERQRLELMRALLKGVDVYIFDEPTSNLDSLNEASFLQLIKEHCQGYVFVISHRPSTVAACEVIYQVKDHQLTLLS